MEVNLNLINRFIVPHQPFITEEEAFRNEKSRVNKRLFAGEQTDVYLEDYLHRIELGGSKLQNANGFISFQSDTAKSFFKAILQGYNLTSPVVETYAGLLFGQGFCITSKDTKAQEWLNGKREGKESFEKYLCKKLYASAIEAGLTGNGVLEVYAEVEDNKPVAKVAVIPSERWYPITSNRDNSEIIANAIVHSYKIKDSLYVNRVVIYAKGYNLYFAVETENGKTKGLVDWEGYKSKIGELPEEIKEIAEYEKIYIEETGLNYSTCQVYSSKTGRVDSPFGRSIISESFKSQERELCIRKTQNGRVLDKNSDPPMTIPESLVEQSKEGDPYVNISGKTIVINKEYDAEPKYVEWSGNLAESREDIKDTIDAIMKETRLAGELLGSSAGTGIVTGEALFRKMTATLSELGTKKMLVELAVENVIKACWQIENPDAEMIDFVVKFADGLPTSEAEKIDNILKKNGNEPIISMADAIKEAYPGISDEEVDDTIAKIQEQRGLGNSLTNSEVI